MITTARRAKTYNTGKPCPQGHTGERYVSSRNCVACVRERTRLWQLANPELHLEKMRRQHVANRARRNAKNRRYHAAHREQLNAQCRRYWAAHKEEINARRRRQRRLQLQSVQQGQS
jgi:hypothetical protein